MKRLLYIIICILAICNQPSQLIGQQRVFADPLYQARLDLAKQLNAGGHYMEACDSLRNLHQNLLAAIQQQDQTAGTLPDTADFVFYQNVLISEAECAYKVNLWKEMESVSTELLHAINERYLADLGQNKDYYWQIASLYKIQGGYHYLRGLEDANHYNKARIAYTDAITYYEKASQTDRQMADREISIVYSELAQLDYTLGNYDEAIDYIEHAISAINTRRSSGSNAQVSFTDAQRQTLNITYQSALAMCLARRYDFRKALNTINGAIARLDKGDKRLPELKRRKAKILLLQHEEKGTDIQDASSLYADYFRAIKDSVNSNFMQMTADQREEYWRQERPFVTDCYLLEDRNPELLYDVTLYNKGILLQTARSFEDLLYDGSQKQKPNERRQLNELRQQDAQNALNGKNTSLGEAYEKKLLQSMNSDGRRKKFFTPLNHTWRDVQNALPAQGCSIEFVEYQKQDSMHFGALVLHKTGKPQFVHVCNADELAEYYPKDLLFTVGTLMEFTDGALKNDLYEDEAMHDAIWTPELVDALGSCQKVYFSADGYLHQLAIEYLLPDRMQKKKLYRLSSTRMLVDGNKINLAKIKTGAALVFGGIMYDSWSSDSTDPDRGNDATAFQTFQERGSSFGYMKGAQTECDSIIYYRNNPNDLYLDGLKATEHAFYEYCSQYPLLHLSTHGSFCGDKEIYPELMASSRKDKLSESVLALANVNTNLSDTDFDAFNKDGLLSAREVARLNLQNVELVTTSACQTGLGYITADGIYGMQRGFKSAGAKGMLITLWSVNVESSRIFFTRFYRYIAEGESVNAAFTHARNDLLTGTFTASVDIPQFSGSKMANKGTSVTINHEFYRPQHSCPYLLIDVWE